MNIKKLTKKEEEIMKVIWQLDRPLMRDIVAALPDKRPPQTVSSVIRLLEDKGFVGHKAYGRTYEYFPLIAKSTYRKAIFSTFFSDYFDGSYQQLASFFVQDQDIDAEELKKLLDDLD